MSTSAKHIDECEGEVAVFSAKHYDRRSRIGLNECVTPCDDAQVVGHFLGSSPVCLTNLAASSELYSNALQRLRRFHNKPTSWSEVIFPLLAPSYGMKTIIEQKLEAIACKLHRNFGFHICATNNR